MARMLAVSERPLDWVGSSKKDLLEFPGAVKDDVGNALGIAQFGGKHPKSKPWKGQGSGVFEVVVDHDGNTFRVVYCVRFPKTVYVLHAFQKKSKRGIATPQQEIRLIRERLKWAERLYTGKAKEV